MGSTTEEGSPAAGEQSKNGAGALKDAPEAFLKAALAWPKAPGADPNAATAFELGWLTRTLQMSGPDATEEVLLGGTGGAPAGIDAWITLRRRIPALTARIKQRLEKQDESQAEVARLPTEPLGDETDPQALEREAAERHQDVLASLFVLDAALADAYTLGRNLRDLRPSPAAGEGLDVVVGKLRDHGQPISEALGRLASKLAPNAAHSIRHSLSLWESEIARLRAGAHAGAGAPRQLRDQIEIWRSMLKGDVAARDLLRASDYVGTVEGVMNRLGAVARASMSRTRLRIFVGVVVVLLLATVALFTLGNDGNGSIAAGLTTFVAALGLSWKGIGEFFGRAAAKGEQALWDAQLDWTIAYRCTLHPEPAGPATAPRAKVQIDEHVKEWKSWQQSWPDLDVDAAADAPADGRATVAAPGSAGG